MLRPAPVLVARLGGARLARAVSHARAMREIDRLVQSIEEAHEEATPAERAAITAAVANLHARLQLRRRGE
jgi:putative hemolysin